MAANVTIVVERGVPPYQAYVVLALVVNMCFSVNAPAMVRSYLITCIPGVMLNGGGDRGFVGAFNPIMGSR